MLVDEKDMFFAKFENRDQDIEDMHEELVETLTKKYNQPISSYQSNGENQNRDTQQEEDD